MSCFTSKCLLRLSHALYSVGVLGLILPLSTSLAGCAFLKRKPKASYDLQSLHENPLSPEESQELLSTLKEDLVFGPALGELALSAGGVFLFPPYAILLLGNSALSLSGYEPLGVSTFLEDETEENWKKVYGGVVSVPGRTIAGVAGEEYRDEEVIEGHLKEFLSRRAARPPEPRMVIEEESE